MDKQDYSKELQDKIPRMIEHLKNGKEITLKITPGGLKVKSADIKIIK